MFGDFTWTKVPTEKDDQKKNKQTQFAQTNEEK